MTNHQLYINGILINLGENFSVRLNRQLLNPAELNTKDAQFSYSITVPAGGINDKAFNYGSIEETRDKFNRLYTAEYLVNSVRVFRGNFKLTGVTRKAYKGNLYVPAPKTIKEIFGEIKLNQNPALNLPFEDFAESINLYNTAALTEPQHAIFPFTLYGVLAKVPLSRNANNYSARTLWDASVRLGIQDLAPSINPLKMLKHIFSSQGYNLQGTAFDDDRLTRLYMSYRNADDYVQPWNYGQHAKFNLSGSWSNVYNMRSANPSAVRAFEVGVNQGQPAYGATFACDMFDSTNSKINILEDSGGNVSYKEVNDASGRTFVNCQLIIPQSGFYKIDFTSQIYLPDTDGWRATDNSTGVQFIATRSDNTDNGFQDTPYEFRLMRDRKTGEFGVQSPKLNSVFYYDNQPQNTTFNADNMPKYFPQREGGVLNMIDLAQDRSHVLGFGWGEYGDRVAEFRNPRDNQYSICQMQAAKPAISWDTSQSIDSITRLAIKSSGWWKWGRIGTFDNGGDNPDADIDFSGGEMVNGKVLDNLGNPANPAGANFDTRVEGYYISALTGFLTPNPDYSVTEFLPLAGYSNLRFSSEVEGLDDLVALAFYDENLQYIGAGIPSETGDDETYANEPIIAPAGAAYFRLTGDTGTITILADNDNSGNVILHRFSLDRFYTYRIEAPAYVDYAYLHNGNETYPMRTPIEFIDGVAEFSTSFSPLLVADVKLTMYLKTPAYDVRETLIISRQIQAGSEEVIDWELTDKYKIDLNGAPTNRVNRGWNGNALKSGNGELHAVVWLEAGERLSLASVSAEGRYRDNGMHSTYGWVEQGVDWSLSIQPFRTDADWLKVDLKGNGTAVMNWNDAPNFDNDSINLVGFLNADLKTDEFIDNFCKAFNLRLSQLDLNTFALDVKQSKTAVSSRYVNLDLIASVADRENTPLGLPSIYKIGFTVDSEEQGYTESGDSGGGEFETGTIEDSVVEQKSNFSYNWFKNITKVEAGGNVTLPLAVISKSDVWAETVPYPEAMRKRYTDLAYRFWYYDGLLNSLGATFAFNGAPLQIAKVSNQIAGVSVLNYKNAPYTILDNYFTILINGSSHYTELEGFLTPRMYVELDGSITAMFNGDLYYIAELGAYDPAGINKTNIKLIRKL